MRRANMLRGTLLVGAIVLAATSAQATNLICKYESGDKAEPDNVRVVLNESAGTAVFGDDPVSKAAFADTTVTWKVLIVSKDDSVYSRDKSYIVDRDSGQLSLTDDMFHGSHRGPGIRVFRRETTYQCTVAKRQF
jgi:hypothetical protein